MRVAIVGGGINGLCCAWVMAQKGHEVELFERDRLMGATSRASSKLLHGGLRYLETFQFRLVREALHERDAWLERAPHLAQPLTLTIPVYAGNRRGRWQFGLGLALYRWLAGASPFKDHAWIDRRTLMERDPELSPVGLKGGYVFTDGLMDDYALGLWVAERARDAGARLHEQMPVFRVSASGEVTPERGESRTYDRAINVAGPWAESLSLRSGQTLPYRLDLVRGSHLVVDRHCAHAYLIEHPEDRRIVFILPWMERTLIGTTEVRQDLDEPIECSEREESYLLEAYTWLKSSASTETPVLDRFAGIRPLIQSAANPNRASREYSIHRGGKLVTVLGGKWTTALALARNVEEVSR